jgi:hypothetical protein
MNEFKKIGRVAASRRLMFESISKEDLMKVLRKVGPDKLRPTFITELETACKQFSCLKKTIEAVKPENLRGDASAKFAKMQEALAPLLSDIECFFKSDDNGNKTFNKKLLLADILNLRQIKTGDVLELLGEVQKKVHEDLVAQPGNVALKEVDENLNKIAVTFTKFQTEVDEVIAPLRVRLKEVESWYDTVMQSFEERYNRGMKTYAFVISLVVAVWLNANIFDIYHDISTNADKRAAIVNSGQAALQHYEEQLAAQEVINNPEAEQKIKALITTTKADIESQAAEYAKFGFKDWTREKAALDGLPGFTKLRRILEMLLGYLIMAALLSLGAPFWHDTLESLLGVKNLLRKRADTKNVEAEAGAGQTQT